MKKRNYSSEETRILDSAILNLAVYDVTEGMVYLFKDKEDEQRMRDLFAQKFNSFKRGIQSGKYTFQFLKDSVLKNNGPYLSDGPKDVEEAIDQVIEESVEDDINDTEHAFNNFTEFIGFLAQKKRDMEEIEEGQEEDLQSVEKKQEVPKMNENEEHADLQRSRIFEAQDLMMEFSRCLGSVEIDHNFSDVVDVMMHCKGKIITTGMGKAGIAMKKFSSLLCSLGMPSCYLHPGEASHGDLGMISDSDILFVASTSGKTREVLEVIELAKKINVSRIIGITSHADSPIRNKADIILDMGEVSEGGYLQLAPTTSILIMIALTDCLASSCAIEKGLTKEEYGKFHHGGYLGSAAREDDNIF